MRALRAVLLILAVFFAQSHLCRAVYVTPDGRDCPTCPYTACPTEIRAESPQKLTSSESKDCRDCCKLTCREESRSKTSLPLQAPHPMVGALLVAELHVPTHALVLPENAHVEVRTHFANAPPSRSDSRAPPASFA